MTVAKPILLALLCALLLAGMQTISEEQISRNRQAHAEQTLRDMIHAENIHLVKTRGLGSAHYQILKAAQDASQAPAQPIGRILQQHTQQGYNGHIAFWVAVDHQGEVMGVRAFAHQETPGLGDKIEHAISPWIDLFKGLSLVNTEEADWALSQEGGRFDGITGATITSRASIRAVHAALLRDAGPTEQTTEETQ